MKNMFLFVVLLFVSAQAFALTLTTPMNACKITGGYGTGVLIQNEFDNHSRVAIETDANGGRTFRCPVQMATDTPIERIEVRFTQDSATNSVTAGMQLDDPSLIWSIPSCRLEVTYSPGGNDFIDLEPKKSVSWGPVNSLEIVNPNMQHNLGTDQIMYATLQCTTGYYSDLTRFFGMRVHYQ
jgi:hypothetical protein